MEIKLNYQGAVVMIGGERKCDLYKQFFGVFEQFSSFISLSPIYINSPFINFGMSVIPLLKTIQVYMPLTGQIKKKIDQIPSKASRQRNNEKQKHIN